MPEVSHADARKFGPLGVDLDNTIVSYDALLFRVAQERGLLKTSVNRAKKAIRDAIRDLPDGEILWQKLQAEIYGPRMSEAKLIEGVDRFFKTCCNRGIPVYIVSHKTEFANYDTTGTNLRTAAMEWLEAEGFFDPNAMGIAREQVFFETTRAEKIGRIEALGCTHFIDDLEETFLEPAFPDRVSGVLYDRHGLYSGRSGARICTAWAEITDYLLGDPA